MYSFGTDGTDRTPNIYAAFLKHTMADPSQPVFYQTDDCKVAYPAWKQAMVGHYGADYKEWVDAVLAAVASAERRVSLYHTASRKIWVHVRSGLTTHARLTFAVSNQGRATFAVSNQIHSRLGIFF